MIDDFTTGYIDCALWSSTTADGEPLANYYNIESLAPSCFQQMIVDCQNFQVDNRAALKASGRTADQQWRDFWLMRNHEPDGIWNVGFDRDIKEALTVAARLFPEFRLTVFSGNPRPIPPMD